MKTAVVKFTCPHCYQASVVSGLITGEGETEIVSGDGLICGRCGQKLDGIWCGEMRAVGEILSRSETIDPETPIE